MSAQQILSDPKAHEPNQHDYFLLPFFCSSFYLIDLSILSLTDTITNQDKKSAFSISALHSDFLHTKCYVVIQAGK
jgi:hypothetical protein